jgi:putative peptidoglycan lipid II flippase
MVYAISFGAGPLMDAFLVAFKIPNFMRRRRPRASPGSCRSFPNTRCGKATRKQASWSRASAACSGSSLRHHADRRVAAPVLAYIFAPGFHSKGTHFDLTVEMLRFTFPYLFFISLVALGSGAEQLQPLAVPALNHAAQHRHGHRGRRRRAHFANPGLVLWGVFVAGFVQLIAQFWRCALWPAALSSFDRAHEGAPDREADAARHLRLLGRAGIAPARYRDRVVPTTGSVTWLYYADRLVEFPMGVFDRPRHRHPAVPACTIPKTPGAPTRRWTGPAAHAHGRRTRSRRPSCSRAR